MPKPEPNYKQILLNLAATLTLADHMGDVCGDLQKVMDLIGIECDVDLSDTAEFRKVLNQHGAKYLFSNEPCWDEEDEEIEAEDE